MFISHQNIHNSALLETIQCVDNWDYRDTSKTTKVTLEWFEINECWLRRNNVYTQYYI